MQITTMAWRNIWRNTRRSVVTIGAMTFSLLMMICASSFYEGMLTKMEANIVEVEIGDIQIHRDGYREDPSIYETINGSGDVVARLEASDFQTAERLLGGGLAASSETSTGAHLFGINVEDDAEVSLVFERVERGLWLDKDDPRGVVVGHLLARTLNISIGDELILLSQAYDGSMANDLYRIRGILGAISEATDRGGVFMIAESFREFYILKEGAHRLTVRRPVDVALTDALAAVKSVAGEATLEVKSWREISPILATMIDSALQMLQIGFLVIYVAVVILLLNAMLMAVFERVREFGILKAVGVSPGSVMALVLTEGAIQTAIAILLGCLMSIPALWYLVNVGIDLGDLGGATVMGMAIDPIIYGMVSSQTFINPLIVLLIVVVLGILYPAIKAAKITPIEAMHHQ
tara:strand:+ start:606 stop:1826 length:1221 start_codon:yes stop_codon:yes gene_type:complete